MSIRSLIASAVLAIGAALAFASSAAAQRGAGRSMPIELGFDAMVARQSFENSVTLLSPDGVSERRPDLTIVAIPAAAFRVGMFLSPRVELEPALGFERLSSGGESATQTDFSVGFPLYFTPNRRATQVFVRPLVGWAKESGVDAQFRFGGGLGVKLPIDPRLAFRLEGQILHANSNDDHDGYNQFGVLFGLSFYTR